jgi:hypothetical protein
MTPQQRVQRTRDKLRAAGLRPIQIWVPDTRAPGFAAEAARQCRLVSADRDPDADELLDHLNDEMADELDQQGL